jgi:hypothetical protein
MGLGVVWCSVRAKARVVAAIRGIKTKHGVPIHSELKWTRVSPAKLEMYLELINLFFDEKDLHFRAILAQRTGLDHERHGQSHDDWYFNMYGLLLHPIIRPNARFRIFLDIKDTKSAPRVRKLHEVLANSTYDFDWKHLEYVQPIRSHESEIMQLTDVLLGVLVSANREHPTTSPAKAALIGLVRQRSGFSLRKSTVLREEKLNLFHWTPSWGAGWR